MIAHTIQLALAPVFVLVAIGNILNLLSTRLGRVVDRVRYLQQRHSETFGSDHDMVVMELRTSDERILLITRAIRSLVISGLSIGTTVAISAPLHERLNAHFDPALLNRLVATNWIRTVAWTARAGLAIAILVAVLR